MGNRLALLKEARELRDDLAHFVYLNRVGRQGVRELLEAQKLVTQLETEEYGEFDEDYGDSFSVSEDEDE